MRVIQQPSRWRRFRAGLSDIGQALRELVPSDSSARHVQHCCRGRHCRAGGMSWALA